MRRGGLLLAAVFVVGAAGCAPVENVPLPAGSEAAGGAIVIKQNAVYSFGDVRIGLGRVSKGGGGLAAEMDLFEAGEPPKERHVSARAGSTFQAGAHSLYVEQLTGGSSGKVQLRELAGSKK